MKTLANLEKTMQYFFNQPLKNITFQPAIKWSGSKRSQSNEIIKHFPLDIDTYFEPFCGGCNVIDKVQCSTKIANDKQLYLIELLRNVNKVKSLPDTITKEHYSSVRSSYYEKNTVYENWYIGAIGFLASYNGRFF